MSQVYSSFPGAAAAAECGALILGSLGQTQQGTAQHDFPLANFFAGQFAERGRDQEWLFLGGFGGGFSRRFRNMVRNGHALPPHCEGNSPTGESWRRWYFRSIGRRRNADRSVP